MNLADILYQYSNDQLQALARLCDCGGLRRKEELVKCLQQALLTPASLRALWLRLDPLSQKAIAAAYHNDGDFNEDAFVAQYGAKPPRPQKRVAGWSYAQPVLLDLFIYNIRQLASNVVTPQLPNDLLPLLAELMPPPDKFKLAGLAQAPETVTGRLGQPIPLICAETEGAGLHDLNAYLRLADQGQIHSGGTYATGRATAASLRKISESLLQGDFFTWLDRQRPQQFIRPVGLDMFARQAGLVSPGQAGTSLTRYGREFYQRRDPTLLLAAFETWSQAGSFDELNRISAIKGQTLRHTALSRPAARREAIVEALSWCPPGVWIEVEAFYRALKIWHFDFDIEITPYTNLYVGHKEYGSLHGLAYRSLIKELYIKVVLWEYLGTLGALDLLYTEPQDAVLSAPIPAAYGEPYLSPYDGLRYFRINNLGTYLLGQTGEYVPARPLEPPLFSLAPSLELTLISPEELTPNDRYMIEQVAAPVRTGKYRLDVQRLLLALETGHDWDYLLDFLRRRHQGALPGEVLTWLERVYQNSQAFKRAGEAVLVRARSADLVDMVMADPVLQKFCRALDDRTLVVPVTKRKLLRARLKELEYLLLE